MIIIKPNKPQNKRRIKIRYALVYFEAKQFNDLELEQDVFITIFKPWRENYMLLQIKKIIFVVKLELSMDGITL